MGLSHLVPKELTVVSAFSGYSFGVPLNLSGALRYVAIPLPIGAVRVKNHRHLYPPTGKQLNAAQKKHSVPSSNSVPPPTPLPLKYSLYIIAFFSFLVVYIYYLGEKGDRHGDGAPVRVDGL